MSSGHAAEASWVTVERLIKSEPQFEKLVRRGCSCEPHVCVKHLIHVTMPSGACGPASPRRRQHKVRAGAAAAARPQVARTPARPQPERQTCSSLTLNLNKRSAFRAAARFTAALRHAGKRGGSARQICSLTQRSDHIPNLGSLYNCTSITATQPLLPGSAAALRRRAETLEGNTGLVSS